MLTIRGEQTKALARAMDAAFIDSLMQSMQAAYPDKCAALGEEQTRALSARSAERAAALGLAAQLQTCRFVALSFAFGEGFETQPGHAWARAIARQEGEASRRLDAAYATAIDTADPATAQALRRADAGSDRLSRQTRRFDPVLPCEQKTWVGILLVGMTGKPVPYERYRIELPDGGSVEGYLDADGLGGADLIDPGACRVTFPDLDQHAVLRAACSAGGGPREE